jgi:hypothetical protein
MPLNHATEAVNTPDQIERTLSSRISNLVSLVGAMLLTIESQFPFG